MNVIEKVVLKMTSDRNSFFVMTAHVEKELNEISGAQQVMTSTLGRKLAPKLPRFFSEVVYAKRTVSGTEAKFTWSTVDVNADLKNRSLPISTSLEPNFRPVVEAYRKRVGKVGGSLPTPTPPSATPVPLKPVLPSAPLTSVANRK